MDNDLGASFRVAANSVTHLYRQAQQQSRVAYSNGGKRAFLTVMDFVHKRQDDRGVIHVGELMAFLRTQLQSAEDMERGPPPPNPTNNSENRESQQEFAIVPSQQTQDMNAHQATPSEAQSIQFQPQQDQQQIPMITSSAHSEVGLFTSPGKKRHHSSVFERPLISADGNELVSSQTSDTIMVDFFEPCLKRGLLS
eukprot:TRINITY_DN15054_c0_g1::TRINITY_DN15054_c0_g1_i1::g.25033::m.25033 TRINITY_DN15054_c0_g1::TRINITY_DN15054_c0_g1_i1::g.25033  ORF type:complete len:196 (-),score=-4.82,DUF4588/PF15251.1/2e-06,DUF1176/PF06674.6/0.031 TRINITY_DN15054_c0_g1_i1:18-605(-)